MTGILSDEPVDQYSLGLISFCCLGFLMEVSNLFIWNIEIFWKYKFRDIYKVWKPASNVTYKLEDELHSYNSTIGTIIPFVVIVPELILLKKWNMMYKLMTCFGGYIFIFSVIIIFALMDTDSWQEEFFYITIAISVLLLIVKNILIASIIFMYSGFPSVYMTAITSGQAICGILSSSANILILFIDASPKISGLLYFSLAVVCIIIALIVYLSLLRYSTFLQYRLNQVILKQKGPQENPKFLLSVLRSQLVSNMSLTFVCGATKMVQPSLTSTIYSMDAGKGYEWNDIYFVPVVTYLVFNVSDLSGKVAALWFARFLNVGVMAILSICRLVLVPLLLIINVSVNYHNQRFLKSDMSYAIYQILLGLTNGLGINILIVIESWKFEDSEEADFFTALILLANILFCDTFSSLAPVIAHLL